MCFPSPFGTHTLDGPRLEAVLLTLVRVEVADILIVRVRELLDIEVDGELLPLVHDVVMVEEEGDVDGVLEGRWVGVLGVVGGGGESDDGLLVGRGGVGLSMKKCSSRSLHVIRGERRWDGVPRVDEHVAKGWRKSRR